MTFYVDLITGHTGIIKAANLSDAEQIADGIWGNRVQLVTVKR